MRVHPALVTIATIVILTAVPLAAAVTRPAGANNESEEHEPVHLIRHGNRTTSCGIERWAVKTGMDPDARKVNVSPVATNIIHLRSLPAPSQLPSDSRVGPTELHTFSVVATILRAKEETDSDYHLVLADTGGRTMIAEIPSPASAMLVPSAARSVASGAASRSASIPDPNGGSIPM